MQCLDFMRADWFCNKMFGPVQYQIPQVQCGWAVSSTAYTWTTQLQLRALMSKPGWDVNQTQQLTDCNWQISQWSGNMWPQMLPVKQIGYYLLFLGLLIEFKLQSYTWYLTRALLGSVSPCQTTQEVRIIWCWLGYKLLSMQKLLKPQKM